MNDQELSFYLEQLHGNDTEHAYFALLTHISDSNIPRLMEAFDAETDIRIKATLVEIIWQQRSVESLNFLAIALTHPIPEIWREALNGIVAIGTQQAAEILRAEITRLSSVTTREVQSRLEWIMEALRQLSE